MKIIILALTLISSPSFAAECKWDFLRADGSSLQSGKNAGVQFKEVLTIKPSFQSATLTYSVDSVMVNPDSSVEFIEVKELNPLGTRSLLSCKQTYLHENEAYVGVSEDCKTLNGVRFLVSCRY